MKINYYKEDGHILAVFPDTKRGQVMECYTHEDQHSHCTQGYLNDLDKATKTEAKELEQELKNLGYEPDNKDGR